ncbi:conserved domain protein, TIGR02271+C111 [Pleurocapsa sp. PCC 7327]|uniref:DUF2382 domain-containing protein n=1 Tax=Pleurocapsa sp. PCC 7327 TaxID=118163 RepID=UPI00029FA1A7|nr:DUF2382 domain-containing protein [Pleurocapsa sp. PCC 7327]AFY78984.1 conserved domain protein, TIGR02271+C111 [Pleurocapsa sp. PCC 7327]
MALRKIGDLYPNYKEDIFGGDDIKNFSVYSDNDKKIGSVQDLLVDEGGRFRYLVINTGFLGLGKKVLLPVGSAKIDYSRERVYASGFTKEQAENLPEYNDNMTVDYDYEERVRHSYRRPTTATAGVAGTATSAYDRSSYSYDRDPELYQMSDREHGRFGQYQNRLMSFKDRFRFGNRTGNNHLYKIGDLYPNYKEDIFDDDDIKGYSVYSDTDERVGGVYDILVDGTGYFRYFVVNTGFLGIGKKILLPIGRTRIDRDRNRIYAAGFTKEQAENLPEYNDDMTVDYDYEERVRNSYRRPTTATAGVAGTAASAYDRDADLYNMNEQNHQQLKLYEERLIANKHRFNTGTVTVGKRVETDTARVSVPVEKERVVIERKEPTSTTPVNSDATAFKEGEVARMEVYEETADVQKQAYVREEVNIRKETDRETVEMQDTVRREELEVDADGNPIIRSDSENRRDRI